MDEALHLLTASENLIQKATEKLTQGRSSIIIAHRLSTIQQADQILVMENGKIVERGTHQELLDQKAIIRNCLMFNSKQMKFKINLFLNFT